MREDGRSSEDFFLFSKQNIKPESLARELSNDQNYFMDYDDDDDDDDDQNYFMDYSNNNVDSCTLVDFIEDHHFSDSIALGNNVSLLAGGGIGKIYF